MLKSTAARMAQLLRSDSDPNSKNSTSEKAATADKIWGYLSLKRPDAMKSIIKKAAKPSNTHPRKIFSLTIVPFALNGEKLEK